MNKTDHELYSTWRHMRHRCHNPNDENFYLYGARGVYVCDEWRDDFWQFVEDVGQRPLNHTLDRIDPDGPYHPDNVRWATHLTQRHNQRRGDTHTGPEHIALMHKARAGLPNRWCCG